jgi:hypothetical protein
VRFENFGVAASCVYCGKSFLALLGTHLVIMHGVPVRAAVKIRKAFYALAEKESKDARNRQVVRQ